MIKVMVVDDHTLVRAGIKRILADESGVKVVAEAEKGEDAVRLAREVNCDVVLMDVRMPGIGGVEATRKLLRANNELKVIALTMCAEEPFTSQLLQAGAAGYLTKDSGFDEMVQAIRAVYHGQRYITTEVAQKLALKSLGSQDPSPFDSLSEREMQVMLMITSGQSVQEISDKLFLSPKTVNSYRYRLFDKLGVNSDVQLTHLAIRYKLLDVSTDLQMNAEENADS